MTTQAISMFRACTEFFGLSPDQRPIKFGREFQKLTNEDRVAIADGLAKLGYKIQPNTITKNT